MTRPRRWSGTRDWIIEFAGAFTTWDAPDFDEATCMQVLCDPQTSGGLLMSVPAESAGRLCEAAASRGALAFEVGRAVAGPAGAVTVR